MIQTIEPNFEIIELFSSVQGEGILQGVPSTIIRLNHCNLNCIWCDTKETLSEAPTHYTLSELLYSIEERGNRYVIITGGEPMITEGIETLSHKLHNTGYHITIETNATIVRNVSCDLISLSPKLSNSQNTNSLKPEVIKFYLQNYNYQVKFVVQSDRDLHEILGLLDSLGSVKMERIILMPQASTIEELLATQQHVVELCIKYGFRYGNRLQLQLWGNEPRH